MCGVWVVAQWDSEAVYRSSHIRSAGTVRVYRA